jgi:hypothetical protein
MPDTSFTQGVANGKIYAGSRGSLSLSPIIKKWFGNGSVRKAIAAIEQIKRE